jgi:hypothetical protein
VLGVPVDYSRMGRVDLVRHGVVIGHLHLTVEGAVAVDDASTDGGGLALTEMGATDVRAQVLERIGWLYEAIADRTPPGPPSERLAFLLAGRPGVRLSIG